MVKTVTVKKILTDEETQKLEGTRLPSGYFKKVFKTDVDVYTEDGNILLKFRKKVLPKRNVDAAYDNMIEHARKLTSTRGMASGNTGKPKLVTNNTKIASNIMGYFDTLSLRQKWQLKEAGMKFPICRQTSFTGQFPDKWKKVTPLMKDINAQYKKLFPSHHKKQYQAAHKTKYVIGNTAFSTLTTNLNLQTAAHTDKGDYPEGFGNLVVIEKGKYKGGYTGFPQYGIAVDVRSGDFLGMDVHQLHGNEPIIGIGKEPHERLSLVSYLREGIVKKCQGLPMVEESYFEKAKEIWAKKNKKTVKKPKQNKKVNKSKTSKKAKKKSKKKTNKTKKAK
jgi:hypothetical protein